MTDTNWCTYCDCAINPSSNFIYCSEECLQRDTMAYHQQSLYMAYDGPQQKDQSNIIQPVFEPIMMSPPEFDYIDQSRRESISSISSEELAAMYFDTIPQTPPFESSNIESLQKSTPSTPPMLSTSISPASSVHCDLINAPASFSYSLPMHEKPTLLAPLTSFQNICMTQSTIRF